MSILTGKHFIILFIFKHIKQTMVTVLVLKIYTFEKLYYALLISIRNNNDTPSPYVRNSAKCFAYLHNFK